EWATTAMSAATPHSCALSARGAACAAAGRIDAARRAAAANFTLVSGKKKRPVSRAPVLCVRLLGLAAAAGVRRGRRRAGGAAVGRGRAGAGGGAGLAGGAGGYRAARRAGGRAAGG